eukprot:scaffold571_cov34-Cyclotella_meneghiniana.AAC.2
MSYDYAPKGGCRSNSIIAPSIRLRPALLSRKHSESPSALHQKHQNNHANAQTTNNHEQSCSFNPTPGLRMMCLGRSDIPESWQCVHANTPVPSAVREIWKKYRDAFLSGDGFRINRSGTSGRKHKYTADGLVQATRNVPLVKRRTLRSLSHHSNIPRSTLHNYLRRGLLKRATSSIKPALKQSNIQRRLNYCRAKVEADGNFNDLMYDVHVDEKWFFVQRIDEKYYLLPDEEDVNLHRSCKHKSHIEKVMFGAAVARPRTNALTGEVWDGKIHLHPFVEYEYAQRSSVNRPAGTRITKPRSINKEVYREWLCEYVVYAIVAQWPDWCERRAQIQQDNATPHIKPTDERW